MGVTGLNSINNYNAILKKKIWEKGFEILKNIEDRTTLQKQLIRVRDPITMITINTKPDDMKKNTKQIQNVDQLADILLMGDQSR
jgi:hypothetical protein